jgi:hypothetical protein
MFHFKYFAVKTWKHTLRFQRYAASCEQLVRDYITLSRSESAYRLLQQKAIGIRKEIELQISFKPKTFHELIECV